MITPDDARRAAGRAARRAHGCRGPAPGRAPRRPGHLLAEGLHPAHDAVPRPLRLLHVRQAAGPPRRAVPRRSTRCSRSPGAGAALGCHEALFTLGEAPGGPLPGRRASGWPRTATRRPSTTSSPPAAAVLEETGLLPHANAGALTPGGARAAAGGQPVAGDDDRDARRPARRAGRPAPRRARQDARRAGSPRSKPRAGRASRSRPASSSASARRAPSGSTRSLAIARRARAPRARAGGDRPELPARSRAPRCTPPRRARPTSSSAHDRASPGSCSAARCTCRRRRTSPTHRAAAMLVAAGIDDWGGVSPRHARPREPRAAVARARRCCAARPKPRARCSRRGSPSTPSTCATPSGGSTPTCASRCSCASDLEGLARDDDWAPGGDDRRRRRSLPPPDAGARRRPGRRGARRRARRRGGRRRRDRHAARRAWSRGRARSCEVADELRREIVGDVVTFVRNRNINYTNVCTFKCRFCAFSKGPLSLNLRGDPYLLELEEIQRRVVEAVECGATEVCLQGGIHPDFDGDYYLDVARAVKAVAPGHPRARLHRARGHRRARAGSACRSASTSRSRRKPGSRRCPAPRPRSSTTRCGRSSAPTRSTPRSGSRRTASRTRVGLRSNVTIMFGHVERPVHVARHLVRTRDAAEGDRRLHRVRPAAVRAHGDADLPAGQGAPRARRSARCC